MRELTKEEALIREKLINAGEEARLIKHSKTSRYYLILENEAYDSETREKVVIYKALYGQGTVWVRPASMFNDDVEINGVIVKRFVPAIDDPDALKALSDFFSLKISPNDKSF